jgi:hypothetical protein
MCTLNNSINTSEWDGVSRVHLESWVAPGSPHAPLCALCQSSMYLLISVECTLSEVLEEGEVPHNAASGTNSSSIHPHSPHFTRILHVYWCPFSDTCNAAAATDSRRFALRRRLIPSQSHHEEPIEESTPFLPKEASQAVFGGWGASAAPVAAQNGIGITGAIDNNGNDDEDDDLERMLARRDAALSTTLASLSITSSSAVTPTLHPSTPQHINTLNTTTDTHSSVLGPLSDVRIDFESESLFLSTQQQHQQHSKDAKNIKDGEDADTQAAWSDEGYESTQVADKFVYRFSKRVGVAPEQVMRWQWRGTPLLLDALPSTATPPPPCERCSAPRMFEMQLMPALPYLLREPLAQHRASPACQKFLKDVLPQLELGTLLCYTCSQDCPPSPPLASGSTNASAPEYLLPEFCILQLEKDS